MSNSTQSSISVISWSLIILPFVKPTYLDNIPFWDNLFSVLAVICCLYLLFIYFTNIGIEKVFMLWSAYFSVFILSTVINGEWNHVLQAIIPLVNGISIYMILRLMIYFDTNLLFRSLLPLLKVIVIWNYATVLLYPNGLYTVTRTTGWESNYAWVLGLRNGEPFFLVFFICLICLDYLCREQTVIKTIFTILYFFITCDTLRRITGGGAYVALLLIVVYLLFHKTIHRIPFFNSVNYVVASVVFFVGVVFFQLQNYFSWFIVGVLGKNLTLTGRTIVWLNAIKEIIKKPILGWGYENEQIISDKLSHNVPYTHGAFMVTHNTFLECLYKGGVVGGFLLILIIIVIIRRNRQNMTEVWTTTSYFLFLVSFILAQTETVTFNKFFLWMIVLTYFSYDIEYLYLNGYDFGELIKIVWKRDSLH